MIVALVVALMLLGGVVGWMIQGQRESTPARAYARPASCDPDKPHRHAIWINHPVTRCAICARDITDPLHNEPNPADGAA